MQLLAASSLALATALSPAEGLGQPPTGYYLSAPVSLPDSLHETRASSRFRVVVIRVARDSFERHLLDQAERLMPSRDTIATAGATITLGNWPNVFARAAALPGDRWWWVSFEDILIPYALTGATAEHLVERVRTLSSRTNRPGPDSAFIRTGSVEYRARIERTTNAEAPWLAQLDVSFRYSCGRRCGLWFTHSRTVEFDASGRVIRVRGDGRPRYTIS